MSDGFRNLVFEGGGVKGVAYVGALAALEERGVLDGVVRTAGTSAGAITATLVALGYTGEELREVLWSLDFRELADESFGVLRDAQRLLEHFGWHKGDTFHAWISARVADKTGDPRTTFRELRERPGCRDLYVFGANLCTRFAEVFSPDHTPDMSVADAVRISMSIPLFFRAVRDERGSVMVDGGVLRNYPIKIFDRTAYVTEDDRRRFAVDVTYYRELNQALERTPSRWGSYVYNKQTLGFRLDTRSAIAVFRDGTDPPAHAIDNLLDYAWNLVMTMTDMQNALHLHGDDWHRTIYIDTGDVQGTDFRLGREAKAWLVDSGARGVAEYFAWFDAAEAINHPDHPRHPHAAT